MNIVVTVKQVPDTWAEKKLDPSDKTTDRASVDNVMNEMDEYGVEEALRIKEAHGGEVTVVTMGPEKAVETIRKALSMGADKAVHLTDAGLHGSDALQTSAALAKVIESLSPDLVITSAEASDARGGVMGALLSERLGLPGLTLARKVTVDPGSSTVTIERQTDDGYAVVEGSLPAVVSVVEKINEPRYPSFKGIMAAKKKPLHHDGARLTPASTRVPWVSATPAARSTTRSRGRRSRPVRSSRTRATAAASWPSSSPSQKFI